MNLTRTQNRLTTTYHGISERKGCSIVILEYKNLYNQIRYTMPITDLVFNELSECICFLKKSGY